jgi:methylated-DNA-protein-cysteine methyltransferase related protein
MKDFYQKVYEVVKMVPQGRVTSYGAIAACLGSPGASRVVGWAMNASHLSDGSIPAHRVVNRNGLLTGKHHFISPDAMQELLESEGVIIKNDQIVRFSDVFWDPVKELPQKYFLNYENNQSYE